ncbi:unnamed protein product [Leptidea sinapis]|uniref:Uncharacterized protein n=1 Tax=Leptidea sinapis TaxID=189913 RepID=A0A5E4PY53_9NEOP|nr:unnamed protein product [Leptidea sinapis]
MLVFHEHRPTLTRRARRKTFVSFNLSSFGAVLAVGRMISFSQYRPPEYREIGPPEPCNRCRKLSVAQLGSSTIQPCHAATSA